MPVCSESYNFRDPISLFDTGVEFARTGITWWTNKLNNMKRKYQKFQAMESLSDQNTFVTLLTFHRRHILMKNLTNISWIPDEMFHHTSLHAAVYPLHVYNQTTFKLMKNTTVTQQTASYLEYLIKKL